MAKYTIEIDNIYALNILAAINETIEVDGTEDIDLQSIYLEEALPHLLTVLCDHVRYSCVVADNKETWRSIAGKVEQLAKGIRTKTDPE